MSSTKLVILDTVLPAIDKSDARWMDLIPRLERLPALTARRSTATVRAAQTFISEAVLNALSYSAGPARVVIEIDGPRLSITVSDRGPGIAGHLQSHGRRVSSDAAAILMAAKSGFSGNPQTNGGNGLHRILASVYGCGPARARISSGTQSFEFAYAGGPGLEDVTRTVADLAAPIVGTEVRLETEAA